MTIWKPRSRAKRRAFKDAHTLAMKHAQKGYDFWANQVGEEGIVTEQGEGPDYHYITAAGPERLAWEAYFDKMVELEQDPWEGYSRFDKELRT